MAIKGLWSAGVAMLAAVVDAQQLQSPEGPSQQCQHDAGPPWGDDAETFPGGRYHDGTRAVAMEPCPQPLAAACQAKGTKAAYLDGPVDCGGAGWFCRIMPQADWVNPQFDDNNFAHCNATNADERDDHGHCHGSDADDTYGWWIRDHWFRGYAGALTCGCGWTKLQGLTNRCDYRRHVEQGADLANCRDANEYHGQGYEDGCEAHRDKTFNDPCSAPDSQCWSVMYFAAGEFGSAGGGGGGGGGGGSGGGGGISGEGGEEDEGDGQGEEDEEEECTTKEHCVARLAAKKADILAPCDGKSGQKKKKCIQSKKKKVKKEVGKAVMQKIFANKLTQLCNKPWKIDDICSDDVWDI